LAWLRTAAGRAKTPGGWPGENGSRLLWAEVYPAGRSVPGGPLRPLAGENPGSGRRRAGSPWLRGWRCRVGAGFESEGGDLDLLVADAQNAVMQGAAKDGVRAVVKRLERRYVAVSPHEHRRCAGEVIRQLRRRSGGGGDVVSSGGMFGSTQCLRKLLKKNF
jgi:hypothetical protein